MIKKRSIAVCIVLSIVTIGIYGIYWFVCLNNDCNKAANNPNGTSGGVARRDGANILVDANVLERQEHHPLRSGEKASGAVPGRRCDSGICG